MKKIQLLFLLVALTGAAFSQKAADLQTICNSLENAQIFWNYRNFKNDFEQMNVQLGAQSNLTYQEYEELHYAYNDIQDSYNGFLGIVRADLSDFGTIKLMLRDSLKYAKSYTDEYRKLIDDYEKNYLPVYDRLHNKGKAIPPQLIVAGVEAFVMIIHVIKNRQELKEEQMNYVLGVINSFFYNKMQMKSWDKLGIAFKGNATPPIGEGVPPRPTTALTEPIDIEPPVFAEMNGYIEFKYLDAKLTAQNMGFALAGGKDIDVEVLISPTQTGTVPIYTNFFKSTQAYGEGTQFQLNVNNSAGMYVFSLNANNDIRFLYPYENDKVKCGKGANLKGGLGKDIEVATLNATPVVEQDIDGNTTLPTKDCSVAPPANRYFTIRGAGTQENFCVLLTKSQLDPQDLAKRLEAESGSLNERLTRVFGQQIISPKEARISMENNRINFDVGAAQNNVMPLLFVIERK